MNTTSDIRPSDDDGNDDLDGLLMQYAHFSVPDDLLSGALQKFDAEYATAYRRRQWLVWGVAMGTLALMAVPLLWAVVFNFALFSKIVAALARVSLFALDGILNMWNQLPALSTGIVISLWMALFVCAALLLKAFRLAIYGEKTI